MMLPVLIVTVLLVLTEVSSQGSRPGNCPLATTVKQCRSNCRNDWECGSGEKCCANSCGSSSCARITAIVAQDKYSSSGTVYCANEKCRPGQTCKADRSTNRPRCSP